MYINGNSIATPLIQNALKLNKCTFKHVYAFPLEIKIFHRIITIRVHRVFRPKFIPFLFAFIFISFILGFGSCALLLILKRFQKAPTVDVKSIVIFLYLGAFVLVEVATYYTYWKSPEIVSLINELLFIERKCKLS